MLMGDVSSSSENGEFQSSFDSDSLTAENFGSISSIFFCRILKSVVWPAGADGVVLTGGVKGLV